MKCRTTEDFENATEIQSFKNIFVIKIETVPTNLQLKFIEVTSSNHFENHFKEIRL